MFEVEKNVEIPRIRVVVKAPRLKKYPWSEMSPGDSFLVPIPEEIADPDERNAYARKLARRAFENFRQWYRGAKKKDRKLMKLRCVHDRRLDEETGRLIGVRVWMLSEEQYIAACAPVAAKG
ncbi:MAG: hypothetical protein ACE5FA_00415 [Dehalococcoidia bacterium]